MLIDRHLRRHRATWLSAGAWRGRLVFTTGAVAIGIAAVLFAHAADFATELFEWLRVRWPYLPVLVTPLGFAFCAWSDPALVRGCPGQRHPAGDRRPPLARPGAPPAAPGRAGDAG